MKMFLEIRIICLSFVSVKASFYLQQSQGQDSKQSKRVRRVISTKECESKESECFFFCDFAHDSIAYDLVKTRLSQAKAY